MTHTCLQVGKVEAITVEAAEYDSCMSIIDSDHKPVWSRLQVTLPVILQDKQRRKCSHLLKDAFLHSLPEPPRIILSADRIRLHPVSLQIYTPFLSYLCHAAWIQILILYLVCSCLRTVCNRANKVGMMR